MIVDYDPLSPVVDLEDAAADRVVIHDALGTNASYTWSLIPDPPAVDAAFAAATHVIKERYLQQRLIPDAMEPRGVVVVPQPVGGDLILYSSTQIPHILKIMAGITLGISESKVRVIAPKITADSPGRGFALFMPFTTQASGSMRAAIRAGGSSDRRNTALAGATTERASAPSRKIPSATAFSQLAGRPARHGPQTPHLGSGSTVTRWPTARSPAFVPSARTCPMNSCPITTPASAG